MTTSPSDETETIKKAVRALHAAWNKKPDEETQAAWAKSLRPYFDRPSLRQAMRESVDGAQPGDWVPTVPALLARMRHIENQAVTSTAPQHAHAEGSLRKRGQAAAIKSLLWLHYEFGWSLEDTGAHTLAAVFGEDVRKAAQAAKENFTRETIRNWMARGGGAASRPMRQNAR
jgi:hypothetical protein